MDHLPLSRFSNSAASPLVVFNKSRNATVGSNTVVQDDDTVGIIRWSGADGTDYSQVADIQGQIDGSPGDNDTPGRLVFSTTSDGASTTTERLRISSSGQLSTGAETAPDVSAGGLCLNQGAADTNILQFIFQFFCIFISPCPHLASFKSELIGTPSLFTFNVRIT